MTGPGTVPWSTGPLVNTILIRLMALKMKEIKESQITWINVIVIIQPQSCNPNRINAFYTFKTVVFIIFIFIFILLRTETRSEYKNLPFAYNVASRSLKITHITLEKIGRNPRSDETTTVEGKPLTANGKWKAKRNKST